MIPGLIILTQQYPFGQGESFLEAELQCYHDQGVAVLLIPFKRAGEQRTVPASVKVWTGHSTSLIRWQASFKVLISGWFWRECLDWRQWSSAAKREQLLFFVKLAICTWGDLTTIESAGQLPPKSVICSYWLSGMTAGALTFGQHKPFTIISRAHGGDVYFHRGPGHYLPARPYLLKGLDQVFVVSEDGARYLREKFPAYAPKILVSRLGTLPPKQRTRASTDGVLRIVSCSFVTAVKQLPLLVDVLRVYQEQQPELKIHWTHIGDGPDLQALQAYAAQQLAGTRVVVHFPGSLRQQEVMNYYEQHAVDVAINVSASEGIPVSLMEAMSAGIPVIAPAVGGIPEMLAGVEDGLFPAHSAPMVIASRLQHIRPQLGNETFRNQYAVIWQERFSAAKNYQAFVQALR